MRTVGRRELLRTGAGVGLAGVGLAGVVAGSAAAGRGSVAFAGGDGSADDPYRIATASHLQRVADDLEAHYELADDVDVTEVDDFEPIGQSSTESMRYFAGSFDGNGREIRGLAVDRREGFCGLFGLVGDATITDVHVVDATISGAETSGGRSEMYVGGLVGVNFGTITDSSVSGDVTGASAVQAVGGLVGDNAGTIAGCTADGEVRGSDDVGGLVGWNRRDATVTDGSEAACDVIGEETAGGLVGENAGTVTDARATGTCTGTETVGGLVGDNAGTVSGSSADVAVSGERRIGGLVGDATNGEVSDSRAGGDVTAEEEVGGLIGYCMRASVSDSSARGDVEGVRIVGGAVGNCRNTTLSRSSASGSVTGMAVVGGLAGRVSGDGGVSESFATGDVVPFFDLDRFEADGSAPSPSVIGGLVGGAGGENVYEDGEQRWVTAGVSAAYATGNIEPAIKADGEFHPNPEERLEMAGGIVGTTTGSVRRAYFAGSVPDAADPVSGSEGETRRTYWDRDAAGRTASDNAPDATGLSTEEMTGAYVDETIGGLDFEDTWRSTREYPALSWEVEDAFAFDIDVPDRVVVLHDDYAVRYVLEEEAGSDGDRRGTGSNHGDTVPLYLWVENPGDEPVTRTVETALDGDVIGSWTIELEPGERLGDEAIGVPFGRIERASLEPGEYEYSVTTEDGSRVGMFVVERATGEDGTGPGDGGDGPDGSEDDRPEGTERPDEDGTQTEDGGGRTERPGESPTEGGGTRTDERTDDGAGGTNTAAGTVTDGTETSTAGRDDRTTGDRGDDAEALPGPGIVGSLASLGGVGYLLANGIRRGGREETSRSGTGED